jgi:hypothetical protein
VELPVSYRLLLLEPVLVPQHHLQVELPAFGSDRLALVRLALEYP